MKAEVRKMPHPVFDEIEKNERVYESLREQLEKDHWDEWVVIVNQQLVAIAPTLEEADRLAEERCPSAEYRLVAKVGEELPDEVWKL